MRKSELRRGKGINKKSDKQKVKDDHWNKVADERCIEEDFICQWCHERGQRTDSERLDYLDGHHLVKRRYNIHTKESCFITHRKCHEEVDRYVKEYREGEL